jgi:hypothetical protein
MNLFHHIHDLLRPVARFCRRALGLDGLDTRLARLEASLAHNAEMLSFALNALAGMNLPLDKVTQTDTYRRASRVISLLSPMDVDGMPFVRVGRQSDGGYVMLDCITPPQIAAAYSFGIADDVSWELDIADRGIEVFLFDHTIAGLPLDHPRFHFSRLGITGTRAAPLLQTLPALLERDGNAGRTDMLLKMDVEGCEWDVLANCPQETLESFQQIVLELHDLVPMICGGSAETIEAALNVLMTTHQCVHVHANTYAPALVLPGLVLPSVVECTFVNRRTFGDRLTSGSRSFPTSLDRSCHARRGDIVLGKWSPTSDNSVT